MFYYSFCRMFVPFQFSQVAEIEYPPCLDGGVVDKMVTLTEEIPRASFTESELDWKEPAPDFFSYSSQSDGQEFADAAHLYQRNPPFKVTRIPFIDCYYFFMGSENFILTILY